MCINCFTPSSHAGTEPHKGLGSIWIVLLTLTLSNAVTTALDIDYFPKREWEYSWILKQTLFPSRSWCTDTSELSGKKHIGSDSKCSRWGWSFPLCRVVLHQTITVWSLHLKPPHIHRQMTRTPGSVAFWLSPWCYCKFLGFFPEESEKHLWNLRVLWDGKGISSLIAGWTSPCYFLKHILRNCVLWGLGLKSCMYCCRQLMLQLSIQLFGHCGVYDNATKC